MRTLKTLAVIIMIAFAAYGCGTNKKKDVIKIGVILPLTGDAAQWGIPPKNGAIIAMEEINATGGINGEKIELIFEDGQCNPQKAITSFNKLITIDKPIAIIGEVCSSATLAIAPIAEENKMVLISPASTNPQITEAGDYIFRVIPSDELRGKVFAEYIYSKGFRNIAILYINNDGGKGNELSFIKYFTAQGGKIILSESYNENAKDVKTILTKIKKNKPDAILSISQITDATFTLINVKELNIKLPLFFQTEALDDPSVLTNAGNSAEGATYISYAKVENTTAQKFAKSYKDKFKKEPELFAAEGYDAVMLIATTLKGKMNANTDTIKQSLYKIKNFEGSSGSLTFDKNGDVEKPLAIKIIENGNRKTIQSR